MKNPLAPTKCNPRSHDRLSSQRTKLVNSDQIAQMLAASRDPDIRPSEGRGVVRPIARHGNDIASMLERVGERELLSGLLFRPTLRHVRSISLRGARMCGIGSDRTQHVEPVELWHHHVEDHDVGIAGRDQL